MFVSNFVNGWITKETTFFPVWGVSSGLSLLFIFGISLSSIIILILYDRRKKEKHKTDAVKFRDPQLLEEYTKELKQEVETTHIDSKPKYWKLLYLVPIDIIIFIFFLFIIFIGSGGFVYSLYRYYELPIEITKVVFLPIAATIGTFSLRLAFPFIFSKIIGAFLFFNTRSLLGLTKQVTIAERLKNNPRFTMASDKLEKQTEVWKTLKQPVLIKELMVFVIPDDVVLQNEGDRVEIFEKKHYDLTKFEVVQCSNGLLVVNRGKMDDKNVIDYNTEIRNMDLSKKYQGGMFNFTNHSTYLFQIGFFCYSFFFLIPLLYKIITKAVCSECDVSFVILDFSFLNFIFGFFFLFPFIVMYKDVNAVLERLVDYIIILRIKTIQNFTYNTPADFEKLTLEKVHNWDLQFQHIFTSSITKAEFVKYLFSLGYCLSKVLSVVFGLVALFTKVKMTHEIFQLIFISTIMELGVLRYLVQPSSIIFNDARLIILLAGQRLKAVQYFLKHHPQDYPKEKLDKIKEAADHFQEVLNYYNSLAIINFCGFFFKSNSIATVWPMNPELYRNSILAFLFTFIPSLITYFVKQVI